MNSSGFKVQVLIDAFVQAYRLDLSDSARVDLTNRIEQSMLSAALVERRACAAICIGRSQLWEATADKKGTVGPLRGEARNRSNEALFLSDAILEGAKDAS